MGSLRDEIAKVAGEIKARDPEPKVEAKVETKVETKPTQETKPPKESKETAPKVEKPPEQTQTATPEASDEPLPEGWADDKRDSFKTLPKDLRDYLRNREGEQKKSYNAKVQEAEKTRKQYERYEPVSKVFEPIRQTLELNGVSEAQYVQRLMAAEDFLRKDPKGALKWLAQNAGVDLTELSAPSTIDPELDKRDQKIAAMSREIESIKGGNQQAVQTQVKSAIESFQNEKDANGAPKYPHFEKVRVAMGALMQSGQAKDLPDAYDRAVMVDPEIRETLIAERIRQHETKMEQDRLKKAEDAKKAGLNIKGSTVVNVQGEKPKNWGDAFRQTARDLNN